MYNLVVYEERDHRLYAHINKVNNKVYFGITRERPKDRWGRGSGYKEGTPIKNAINKYGWDGFRHLVILDNLTHREALGLEKHFIKVFKSQNKKVGYNVECGGKEGYLSAEARRKQKEKGCIKEVICLETKEVFPTATAAAEAMGLVPSSVMKTCNSKRYVLFDLHFMHYVEFINSTPEKIEQIMKLKPKNIFNDKRKVIVLETKEVFLNAKEAQKTYKSTNENCILCCCKRGDRNRITAGGVHWMFLKDYESASIEEINQVLASKRGQRACKPVMNLFSMKKYNSIEEASKETGISSKTIRNSCRGLHRSHKDSGKWVFLEKFNVSQKECYD
jgi:hypothetical protein